LLITECRKIHRYRYYSFFALQAVDAREQENLSPICISRVDQPGEKTASYYKTDYYFFANSVCGVNGNWPLADFEVHEIMESIDDYQGLQYRPSRNQTIAYDPGPARQLNVAIQQKSDYPVQSFLPVTYQHL